METLAVAGMLIVVVVGQFSLLWWRIGRLEGKVDSLNHNFSKGRKKK